MNSLLNLAQRIDWLSDRFGDLAKWAVPAACLISTGNAAVRHALNIVSDAVEQLSYGRPPPRPGA